MVDPADPVEVGADGFPALTMLLSSAVCAAQ